VVNRSVSSLGTYHFAVYIVFMPTSSFARGAVNSISVSALAAGARERSAMAEKMKIFFCSNESHCVPNTRWIR
jgi:hypothetical protein